MAQQDFLQDTPEQEAGSRPESVRDGDATVNRLCLTARPSGGSLHLSNSVLCRSGSQHGSVRRTQLSQLCYLFEDVQVVNGDLVFIEPAAVPHTPAPEARPNLMGAITVQKLGKTLGMGVVSGFGGQIGALIFDAIFPPGVPDYFNEVYKEIRNIVKQEIKSGNIDIINGRINGVVQWANNTYKPRKQSGASRDELSGMLTPHVDKLYTEAAATLMLPDYAKPGLPIFLIVAGVHLALFQEQALVDPKQPDPAQSSYAKTVKLNAQIYADHAVKTFNDVLDDRRNAVEIKYDPLVIQDPGSPSVDTKARYRWFDTVANKLGSLHEQYMDKDKKSHSGREEAEADRQNYLTGVLAQLTNTLDTPLDTAGQWRKLIAKPIPALAGAGA